MLIYKLRDIYRELTGHSEPVAPVTPVVSRRPAANADSITQSDRGLRRQRRQRRAGQPGLVNISGWTVRAW